MSKTATIRLRTAYQAIMFAAFNLFRTAVPLLLAMRFDLGQGGNALFALAGAGAVLVTAALLLFLTEPRRRSS